MTYERARILDCKCADRSCFGISSRSSSAFFMLAALLALSCSLGPTPKQMYEGPPLPKEQVGIVRNGCAVETGLSIMVMHIDGKNVPDPCADFALLPGEHQIKTDVVAQRRQHCLIGRQRPCRQRVCGRWLSE